MWAFFVGEIVPGNAGVTNGISNFGSRVALRSICLVGLRHPALQELTGTIAPDIRR